MTSYHRIGTPWRPLNSARLGPGQRGWRRDAATVAATHINEDGEPRHRGRGTCCAQARAARPGRAGLRGRWQQEAQGRGALGPREPAAKQTALPGGTLRAADAVELRGELAKWPGPVRGTPLETGKPRLGLRPPPANRAPS